MTDANESYDEWSDFSGAGYVLEESECVFRENTGLICYCERREQ